MIREISKILRNIYNFFVSIIKIFQRRIILISIENFNREFPGKLILSKFFANEGYIVLLAHKSITRALVSFLPLKNHIYIEKGNRFGSIKYLSRAKKNNLFIYCFDEEGLMQTDFNTYLKRNHENKTVEIIDGVFSWGPFHTTLLKKSGFNERQILKTGNTRFDHYLNTKEELSTNSTKKKGLILICSRFASANPNKEIKLNKDKRDGSNQYIIDSKKMLERMLKIPRLIRENGLKNQIIVRPHPSESKKIWQKACKGLDNVVISCEEPINKILLKTNVLIHNRCTTAIEGFLFKVKVISYEPFNLDSPPSPNKDFINSFATHICESDLDLINKLKSNKEISTNYYKKEANKFIYNIGSLSSLKIIKIIQKVHPSKINNNLLSILLIIFFLPVIVLHHKTFQFKNRIFNNKYYLYLKQKNGTIASQKICKLYEKFLNIRLFSRINIFIPF